MQSKIYRHPEVTVNHLQRYTIAIIGYGSQGRSHALNLRDSGLDIVVGQRDGGKGFKKAIDDGFNPIPIVDAVDAADIISIQLPDEVHGQLIDQFAARLNPQKVLLFCHGFSVHFKQFKYPAGVPILLVAPKGAGHMVRIEYENGGGVPCLFAIGPSADDSHKPIALAYAAGLGGARLGIIETSFAEETETDLFGEQAVLCGGISELVQAAFNTLVEAGYRPEMAYFECLHELKLTVDLLHRGGLTLMHQKISNTAEFGDYTRGSKVIGPEVKKAMQEILGEIQSGQFAQEWKQESERGLPTMKRRRELHESLLIEQVGKELRKNVIWSNAIKKPEDI